MMAVAQRNINVTVKKTGSKKGAVTFNHRKHKKYVIELKKCKTCHHVGRYHQSCGEAGCHNDPKKDDWGNRIHKTCLKKCHKANEAKAPTGCLDKRCHSK